MAVIPFWKLHLIFGTRGDDTLAGGDGVDLIFGRAGDDLITGGGGNDLLFGGAGTDTLDGGPGHDLLVGGRGADTLLGGDGNDILLADSGSDGDSDGGSDGGSDDDEDGIRHVMPDDLLDGGAGDDLIRAGAGMDTVIGGAGNDRVYAGSGDDRAIYRLSDNLGATDLYHGGSGTDTLHLVLGLDQALDPAVQNDLAAYASFLGSQPAGGSDDDEDGDDEDGAGFKFTAFGLEARSFEAMNVSVEGVMPGDAIVQPGTAGPDTLIGTDGSDMLLGGEGDDHLEGGGDSDMLAGGLGDDVLYPGDGDDVADGGEGDDLIIGGSGAGNDTYIGGTGIDTVTYASTIEGVEVDLHAGYARGREIGTDKLFDIENVIGGAGGDVIRGDRDSNRLDGTGGDDTLEGRGGDDALIGGAGLDIAVFGGNWRDYEVTHPDKETVIVTDATIVRDGTDTLTAVERARFADGTFFIDGTNNAPDTADDALSTDEDSALKIAAGALLSNDGDFDGDAFTITNVGKAVNGTVALKRGTVLFAPDPHFSGTAAFDYTVTDARNGVSTATVTVDVAPVADAPNLAAEDASGESGTPIPIEIGATLVDADGSELLSVTVAGVPAGASLSAGTDNGDSTWTLTPTDLEGLTLTPATDFVGNISLSVTATAREQANGDEASSLASATVTVVPPNNPPVATDSLAATNAETTVSGTLTAKDLDPADILTFSLETAPSNGSVVIAPDGTYAYTPDLRFGGQDSFVFRVDDGRGGSDTATVDITVAPSLADVRYAEAVVDQTIPNARSAPEVVALPDGGHLVVWSAKTSVDPNPFATGIFGQRYDADGARTGDEFLISTTELGRRHGPSVAVLDDGGFIVVWTGDDEGDVDGVFGRQFDALGTAVGQEFRVNQLSAYHNFAPSVGALVDGGFAVSWTVDSDKSAPYARVASRMYDGTIDPATNEPNPIGDPFYMPFVHNETQGGYTETVAGLLSGRFVTVGTLHGGNPVNRADVVGGVYEADGTPERYFAAGIPSGTRGLQEAASVGALKYGGFVVVWRSYPPGGDEASVYGQRFTEGGSHASYMFKVNTLATHKPVPKIQGLDDGGFVIIWESRLEPDSPGTGISGQRYDYYGNAVGEEFLITDPILPGGDHPSPPSLAVRDDGALVVSWPDWQYQQINQKIIESDSVVQFAGEVVDDTIETLYKKGPVIVAALSGGGHAVVWPILVGSHPVDVRGYLFDESGQVVSSIYVGYGDGHLFDPSIAALDDGGFVVVWADEATGDIFGKRFDAAGLAVSQQFQISQAAAGAVDPSVGALAGGGFAVSWASVSPTSDIMTRIYDETIDPVTNEPNPVGDPFVANSFTTTSRAVNAYVARNDALTGLTTGRFVTVWTDTSGADDSGNGVYARLYNADGTAVSAAEFQVNTTTSGDQGMASVSALSNGGFVVVWRDLSDISGSGYGARVTGQRFDADGNPVGGEFQVNTISPYQTHPTVQGLDDGGFTVLWASRATGYPSGRNISGQRYDADGNEVGAEFVVNKLDYGANFFPSVALRDDGALVVTWLEDKNREMKRSIIESDSDVRYLDEIVSQETPGAEATPEVAALPDGGHLVVWSAHAGADPDSSYAGVYGQRYTADGERAGNEFLINTTVVGWQTNPAVAVLDDGGFVVVWNGNGPGDINAVFGQQFDTAGTAIGQEFRVNQAAPENQQLASVDALAGGGFVVTWTSTNEASATSQEDIVARIFDGTIDPATNQPSPAGDQFLTNTITTGVQRGGVSETIAGLTSGRFVTVWTDAAGENADLTNVYARLYEADGTPVSAAEFQVNTISSDTHDFASVGALGDGGFVITWTGTVGSQPVILGQRFDADGGTVGAEFQINSVLPSPFARPKIQGLEDGGFAVVWHAPAAFSIDNYRPYNISGQRYDASGAKVDTEFVINTPGLGVNARPSLAVRDDGGLVVAWHDATLDRIQQSIVRFSGSDDPKILVGGPGNDSFIGSSAADELAGLGGNDRLVGLEGDDILLGGPGDDILHGGRGADELRGGPGRDALYGGEDDDTYVIENDSQTVTETADNGIDTVEAHIGYTLGNHVENLVLTGNAATGEGNALDNIIRGNPGQANTLFGLDGNDHLYGGFRDDRLYGGGHDDVLYSGAGNDLVVGGLGDDRIIGGSGAGIDTYDGGGGTDTVDYSSAKLSVAVDLDAGSATGSEIHSDTLIDIENVIGGSGRDVIRGDGADNLLDGAGGHDTLEGRGGNDRLIGGDLTDTAVFSGNWRDYTITYPAAKEVIVADKIQGRDDTDTLIEVERAAFADGTFFIDGTNNAPFAADDQVVANEGTPRVFSAKALLANDDDFDGNALAITAVGNAVNGTVTLTKGGAVFTSDPDFSGTAAFDYTASDGRGGFSTATVTVDVDPVADAPSLVLSDVTVDQSPAESGDGPEFRVNSTTPGDQAKPDITPLADGGFVAVWQSASLTTGNHTIFGQRYDAAGGAVGEQFQVSEIIDQYPPVGPDYNAIDAEVTGLADGGFVVSWQSNAVGRPNIYVQAFDAAGVKIGGEFRISAPSTTQHKYAALAPLADGGFLVTWSSLNADGNGYGVLAQRFDAVRLPLSRDGETVAWDRYVINEDPYGFQGFSAAAQLANGTVVHVWESNATSQINSSDLAGRLFNNAGVPLGGQFPVNRTFSGDQTQPEIAALDDGGFVVVWTSRVQDGSGRGVYGRRFDADGHPVSLEFLVNTATFNDQDQVDVAALAGGGFVVTWRSVGQDGSVSSIFAQRYDANGNAVGGETPVNVHTDDNQQEPAVAALANGSFAVAWQSLNQDGHGEGIYARVFDRPGGTEVPLDISVALADADGSEVLSHITIAGMPDGAKLSAGTDNGNGTWTLAPADLAGLILTTPSGFTGDLPLTVSATAFEQSTGETASTTASLMITVLAPLFTDEADVIDFNAVAAGTYIGGTQYDARDGNDQVILADDPVPAGYDALQTFHGGAGDDVIAGGLAAYRMAGDAGNDTLASSGNDTAVYAGNVLDFSLVALKSDLRVSDLDPADGNEGTDTLSNFDALQFADYEGRLVQWTAIPKGGELVMRNGNDIAVGSAGYDAATYLGNNAAVTVDLALVGPQNTVGSGFDYLIGIAHLTGTDLGDTLRGDDSANTLFGGNFGVDVLEGRGGNDVLIGGADNDTLDGGPDTDTAVYSGVSGDYSTSFGADGSVTIVDSVAGRDGTDTLTSVELAQFLDGVFFLDGTNNAPVAATDWATIAKDTATLIDVLSNDTDLDGDTLSVTAASAGHGTVAPHPGGPLLYTPDTGYSGADTITYTVSDGNGGTDTGTAFVRVDPAPMSPPPEYSDLVYMLVVPGVFGGNTDFGPHGAFILDDFAFTVDRPGAGGLSYPYTPPAFSGLTVNFAETSIDFGAIDRALVEARSDTVSLVGWKGPGIDPATGSGLIPAAEVVRLDLAGAVVTQTATVAQDSGFDRSAHYSLAAMNFEMAEGLGPVPVSYDLLAQGGTIASDPAAARAAAGTSDDGTNPTYQMLFTPDGGGDTGSVEIGGFTMGLGTALAGDGFHVLPVADEVTVTGDFTALSALLLDDTIAGRTGRIDIRYGAQAHYIFDNTVITSLEVGAETGSLRFGYEAFTERLANDTYIYGYDFTRESEHILPDIPPSVPTTDYSNLVYMLVVPGVFGGNTDFGPHGAFILDDFAFGVDASAVDGLAFNGLTVNFAETNIDFGAIDRALFEARPESISLVGWRGPGREPAAEVVRLDLAGAVVTQTATVAQDSGFDRSAHYSFAAINFDMLDGGPFSYDLFAQGGTIASDPAAVRAAAGTSDDGTNPTYQMLYTPYTPDGSGETGSVEIGGFTMGLGTALAGDGFHVLPVADEVTVTGDFTALSALLLDDTIAGRTGRIDIRYGAQAHYTFDNTVITSLEVGAETGSLRFGYEAFTERLANDTYIYGYDFTRQGEHILSEIPPSVPTTDYSNLVYMLVVPGVFGGNTDFGPHGAFILDDFAFGVDASAVDGLAFNGLTVNFAETNIDFGAIDRALFEARAESISLVGWRGPGREPAAEVVRLDLAGAVVTQTATVAQDSGFDRSAHYSFAAINFDMLGGDPFTYDLFAQGGTIASDPAAARAAAGTSDDGTNPTYQMLYTPDGGGETRSVEIGGFTMGLGTALAGDGFHTFPVVDEVTVTGDFTELSTLLLDDTIAGGTGRIDIRYGAQAHYTFDNTVITSLEVGAETGTLRFGYEAFTERLANDTYIYGYDFTRQGEHILPDIVPPAPTAAALGLAATQPGSAPAIEGGAGDDTLTGGVGNDTVAGGAGNDTLTGGGGSDIFVFAAGDGDDTITDFEVGIDTLELLDGLGFDATAPLTETDVDADGVTDTLVLFDSGDTVGLLGITGITDVDQLIL